jgi:VWFA-related protein
MAMLSHRYGWSSALALFIFPCIFFAEIVGDPAATYRTTVSEVRVTFFATDENNHPVDTVRKEDFAVVDNGIVVREFRSLSRSDETSLDVVVAVDASESVAPRLQATMTDVLHLVSQKQVADDDNISVVSFGGLQPVMMCTRNCRSLAAGQQLLAVRAGGATPLFDALAYSANFISSRHTPGVRPVLIVFSDGNDTISKHSAPDALEAVIASGALLYTIDLNKPGSATNGSVALQRMAEASGGRYLSIREGAANVLEAALEDLRASYIVTYKLPSRAVGFHSLYILPKHDLKLRFHCRSGYYYTAGIS